MNKNSVALGADHAGFQLKEEIKKWLVKNNYNVSDKGTHSPDSVDYPDFAKLVSNEVVNGQCKYGILVCGSGIGMCMSANRNKGIRAVVIQNENDAKLSREHNNANIACFGARFINSKKAIFLLDIFLNTDFEGGRHEKRVKKIDL